MIKYDDLTHTYWVEGQICPSVTQILAWKFPGKYRSVDKEVLAEASRKGTELHNAIEVYEKYGIEREDLVEFRNYLFLKERFDFKVVGNELMVAMKHKDLTVCGRTDLLIEYNGKLGLADIKRTATCDKEYLAYQLNMYKMAYEQTYHKPIWELQCLWLREDKRKVVDIPVNTKMVEELLDEYIKEHDNVK